MMAEIISVVVFLIVMAAIVTEKVHRAIAAIAGAVVLMLTHVLTFDEALEHVDFNTLGVLLGMMLFVGAVKNSGLFEYVAIKATKIARGDPWRILVAFMIITALFSAMLDNVTTVLLIAPMTLTITRILQVNPIPFLFTQILASNIGGTSTLIGDPPNIMIGSAAGLDFMDFILNEGPVVVVILIVVIFIMKLVYGKGLMVDEESMRQVMMLDEQKAIKSKPLMKKSIVMIIVVAAGFVLHGNLGVESGVVALTCAAVLIIIGGQDAEDVIADVEWPTIIFFLGLFIVVGGMVETGFIGRIADLLIENTTGHPVITMLVLLWASAILSAVLDNIPFVATLIPLVIAMGESGIDVAPLWWAISLGACLGGNGTLIGASANVVVASISAKNGYPITFKAFFRVGFPVMIVTIAIATVYVLLRYA
ncbi:MAG: ArsB/NhaD family transporter [Anaerovoracaceae bacterium]|jgi:Na+/H+ antiporter NhaD/arsenite permease-like protein